MCYFYAVPSFKRLDVINFLGKLTPARVINAAKILVSYYFSKYTRRLWHWGYPITLSIEPTTACNLRCPECPSGLRKFSRATGNIQEKDFRRVIDQLSNKLIYLIFYFQGEPFIHPRFLDMVSEASLKGLYTITSTNGHFLDDRCAEQTVRSGLDRIIISIDGTTQDTYSAYRKEGSLEKVKEGTKNIVKWKKTLRSKTPHIVYQFLVVAPNEHQIPEVFQLAEEMGVDEVKLKTAQVYNYRHGNPLIPKNEKFARYRKKPDGTYEVKHSILNECWKMWHSAVVTWNGLVVPCCFDKDASHVMGSTVQDDFATIWKSKDYDKFRKRILEDRSQIDICQNCTEGCSVWA